jgi:hypothetical protein
MTNQQKQTGKYGKKELHNKINNNQTEENRSGLKMTLTTEISININFPLSYSI